MNMLRVGGTMVYESDALLRRLRRARASWSGRTSCSPTWTTPRTTRRSSRACRREARQQLARLRSAARALAVLCGNSEVEQQAAMWGAPRERWSPRAVPRHAARALRARAVPGRAVLAVERARRRVPAPGRRRHHLVLRRRRLPAAARRRAPRRACASPPSAWRSPTCPSAHARSACPAATDACTTRRGRRARRATSAPAGTSTTCATTTSSALFGVDPAALRYADHERYLALGRVATGEVMAAAFGEWRRARSTLPRRAGLVPARPVAGRGLGRGRRGGRCPRPPIYYLRARARAGRACTLSDEGSNGLDVHVVNDAPRRSPASSSSRSSAPARSRSAARRARSRWVRTPRSSSPAAELFDGFIDLSLRLPLRSAAVRSGGRDASPAPRRSTFRSGCPRARGRSRLHCRALRRRARAEHAPVRAIRVGRPRWLRG